MSKIVAFILVQPNLALGWSAYTCSLKIWVMGDYVLFVTAQVLVSAKDY
jgi:hypothetical protein